MKSCMYHIEIINGKININLSIKNTKLLNEVVIEKLMKVINEIEYLESDDGE